MSRPIPCLAAAILALSLTAPAAEPVTETFADAAALERLKTSGEVTLDSERSATDDGSGALRLGPKAAVVFPLRKEDGSGRVAFSVYEDGSVPKDPKKRVVGATWGVALNNGRQLTTGAYYAPYLAGDDSYALSHHAKGDSPYGFIRYLGIKRGQGWHRWVFDFDAEQGLTISCDGAPVTAKRFDWNETQQGGFAQLVFAGDTTDGAGELLIDDIEVTLGGPMQVGPKPKPPLTSVTPDTDPAVEGDVVTLAEDVVGVHPRVLFGPEELEAMKAFYATDAAKQFREELEGYIGPCRAPAKDEVKFLKDATDGQRHGYWRMPTVGLHYLLTGDRGSFDRAKGYMELLLSLENWEVGGELDSGMSAANVMIGAGLLLDWLWHDLDPEFREAYRQKCLLHARRMFHGGHLLKSPHKAKYWQADPANNHRWHRNAGLASCLYAAATNAPEEAWLMTEFKQELDYIARWLPHDGTTHESPGYMTFGISHLVVGMRAADNCIGTEYLQNEFFANVPRFKVQSKLPGFTGSFNFGDQGGTGIGNLGYDLALYELCSIHGLKEEQAALDKIRAEKGAGWGWMGLVYYDPELAGGSLDDLAKTAYFPDIGVLWSRQSWEAGAGAVQFKCGPFGGFGLNEFRNSGGGYINVAHDDPDANSFLLIKDGNYLAETDRYSERKKSANHNTILINGVGQQVPGRSEGGVWSQPATDGSDMTKMAYVTAVAMTDGVDLIEGEAAGSYLQLEASKKGAARPDLERYRRALAHVKGRYVLVLDDIRSPSPVTVTWMVQGKVLEPTDGERSWVLKRDGSSCPFRIETDRNDEVEWSIIDSPADHKKKKLLGWKQLRGEVETDRLVVASAYDLYGTPLDVALDTSDPATIVATVTIDGGEEVWTWTPAEGRTETYTLEGVAADGSVIGSYGPEDRPDEAP